MKDFHYAAFNSFKIKSMSCCYVAWKALFKDIKKKYPSLNIFS